MTYLILALFVSCIIFLCGIDFLFGKEGNVNAAEKKQSKNYLVGRFTWRIENFSSLNVSKLYSSTFAIDENKWRLMLYPNYADNLSLYLQVPDSASLPDGWSITVSYSIALINQWDSTKTIKEESEHQFTAIQRSWGYSSFLPLSKLHNKWGGYLVNDTCLIEAQVSVVADKPKPFDDDVESVYVKAKSLLESIPKKSCSPISDATLKVLLFNGHGIFAKECFNNLMSIPLNDLANPKLEAAMLKTLCLLSDNLSLFSDEQAKEIMNLKATFPKIIQDLRELVKVKVSNQHVSSTFEKMSNLLEDLVKTDGGIKRQLEELSEREKELDAQMKELKAKMKVVRSKSCQLKEARGEVSKQTKQIHGLVEEQLCSRKIEEEKPEVNLANKKLEDLECKWASIKALFT